MGMSSYPVQVLDEEDRVIGTYDLWVDTGSTYTWLSRAVFEKAGVVARRNYTCRLADGTRETKPVAQLRISLGGEPFATYCAATDEKDALLLGAVALEEAGLAVDPVERRLVSADGFALTMVEQGR